MMSPQLSRALAQARVDDLRRDAAAPSRAHRHAQPVATQQSVTLRFGSPADEQGLSRLAALDSAKTPVLPVLLAEVDGQLLAALALSDGSVVADPFHPTADLIDLLRSRARQLDANTKLRRPGRLRSPSRLRAPAWR